MTQLLKATSLLLNLLYTSDGFARWHFILEERVRNLRAEDAKLDRLVVRRLDEGRDCRSWKSWHVSFRRVAVRQLPQRRTKGGWLPKLIKGGVSSTWTIDRLYELRRSIKPRFNLRRKCWSIFQRQRLFFFSPTPPSSDLLTATTWLNVTLASTRITFQEWKRVTFTIYFAGYNLKQANGLVIILCGGGGGGG